MVGLYTARTENAVWYFASVLSEKREDKEEERARNE